MIIQTLFLILTPSFFSGHTLLIQFIRQKRLSADTLNRDLGISQIYPEHIIY